MYSELRGFVYIIGASGRQLAQDEGIASPILNVMLAAKNFLTGLRDGMEKGMRPDDDGGVFKFNKRVDLRQAAWREDIPVSDDSYESPSGDIRISFDEVFSQGRGLDMANLRLDLKFKDPVTQNLILLGDAIERQTAMATAYLYRPQKFNSTTVDGRNGFAAAVLKSYATWFAVEYLGDKSPQRHALISQTVIDKWIKPFERLVDRLAEKNLMNDHSLAGEVANRALFWAHDEPPVDQLDRKRLQGLFDQAMGESDLADARDFYLQTRRALGQQFQDHDLFRDIMLILQTIKEDLNHYAGSKANLVMGSTDTQFGEGAWPHLLDHYWASTGFIKAFRICDPEYVRLMITPELYIRK
jgi:hypothetical protein